MSDKTIAVFADTAEAYEELCSGRGRWEGGRLRCGPATRPTRSASRRGVRA